MTGEKSLILGTCLIVAAAAGAYLWGEASAAIDRHEQTERIEGARAELFSIAKAEPYETTKVETACKIWANPPQSLKNNPFLPGIVRNCRALGYLN